MEEAARPQAQLAGIDVEVILSVPPIGVADAVVIAERSPDIEALHALHEVDIQVDAPLRQGVAPAPPIARESRPGPEITAVIFDLRELRPRHAADPHPDDTQTRRQLLHRRSSPGKRWQVVAHHGSVACHRGPCSCLPPQAKPNSLLREATERSPYSSTVPRMAGR